MSHLARTPSAYANTWVTRRNPSLENTKWPWCSPLTGPGEQALCRRRFPWQGLLASCWSSRTHTRAPGYKFSSSGQGDEERRRRSAICQDTVYSALAVQGTMPCPRYLASPQAAPHFPFACSCQPGSCHRVQFSCLGPSAAETNQIRAA